MFGINLENFISNERYSSNTTGEPKVWLDPCKTTPYDFYQYWRNVDDRCVKKMLGIYTFLPIDEVRRLGELKDSEINLAKKILAYEITKFIHGEEEADKAKKASDTLFGCSKDFNAVPSILMSKAKLYHGIKIVELILESKLALSKSEARRLIQQGGIKINGKLITDFELVINADDINDGYILLQRGKKNYFRIVTGN